MNRVLVQLAVAIGFLMFFLCLGVGLANDVPILVTIFRALIAFCVCSVAVTWFFRFFLGVVYRFVAERVLQQNRQKAEGAARASSGGLGSAETHR